MAPQPSPLPRRSFGPFEFNTATSELRKFGSRIRLQGQPIQILELLLERPGELVTREEMQRRLWNGAAFVDSERGLNAAVNKLRQALGDSADQPRYVETIAGRGYRFVGPLAMPPSELKAVSQMPPVADKALLTQPRSRPWPWLWPAAGGFALGAAILGLAWRLSAPAVPATRTVRFHVPAPPGYALEISAARSSLALSGDGSRLAFTAMDSSGLFHAFVRELSSLETRPVPGSAGAHTLFWGPDADSLYVTMGGKLRHLSLDGKKSVILGNTPPMTASGAWLAPDRVMVSSLWKSVSSSQQTLGRQSRELPHACPWPQLLPGGLLCTVYDGAARKFKPRLMDPDREIALEVDSRAQYAQGARGAYLLHVRAGSLIAIPFDASTGRLGTESRVVASGVSWFAPMGAVDVAASRGGVLAYVTYGNRSQLAWVNRAGVRVGVVGPANVNLTSGRISPDGKLVAAAIHEPETGLQDLWLFDTATGERRRLTADVALRDAPAWAPDSKLLAYMSKPVDRTTPSVHVRGLGLQDIQEARAEGGFQFVTDWSADGRFIAYSSSGIPRAASEAQNDVLLVDRKRGKDAPAIPLLNSAFNEANLMFSPDGKWVAFTSNESGQPEMYLQAFEGQSSSPRLVGKRFLASRAGAIAIRWRRDMSELFYLGFDGRVYAVPLRLPLGAAPAFGKAEPLFAISTEARAAVHAVMGFDVSADGQRFLIPVVDTAKDAPAIVVVQNWDAL